MTKLRLVSNPNQSFATLQCATQRFQTGIKVDFGARFRGLGGRARRLGPWHGKGFYLGGGGEGGFNPAAGRFHGFTCQMRPSAVFHPR